jgi:hypothetical protein
MTIKIYLNVYDLTPFNYYLDPLGFGAYHTAIQINGEEYQYGGHQFTSTGVTVGQPGTSNNTIFRK